MNEPLKIIADIISHELSIDKSRILIYNNDFNFPKDKKMYVLLSLVKTDTFGASSKYKTVNEEYIQEQTINLRDTIRISLVSRGSEARENFPFVQMSMNSDYAIKRMEENGVHIQKVFDVMDLSFVEGAGSWSRFDMEVGVLYSKMKNTVVDYYDSFSYENKIEP